LASRVSAAILNIRQQQSLIKSNKNDDVNPFAFILLLPLLLLSL
jgi:hypothetical protein